MWREPSRLIEQGKVKHFGLSEAGAQTIRRATSVHPSQRCRASIRCGPEIPNKTACLLFAKSWELVLSVQPSWAGFLTGKIETTTEFHSTDFRNHSPRFAPEARAANLALVDLLRHIAERKRATPAQLALAWLLSQKPWIVPIPGTTKLHRLEENLGAAGIELTPDDLREIEDAASKITIQGARLPEAVLECRSADGEGQRCAVRAPLHAQGAGKPKQTQAVSSGNWRFRPQSRPSFLTMLRNVGQNGAKAGPYRAAAFLRSPADFTRIKRTSH